MVTEQAYLDDILLETQTIDDQYPVAVARFEYPYVDGADLEPMGQKAHTVKIRCYFWDDGGGHATYEAHKAVLAALEKKSAFELTHPKYGRMSGQVENVSVRHDERKRLAEIDLDFTEQRIARQTAAAPVAIDTRGDSLFIAALDEQYPELIDDLGSDLDPTAVVSEGPLVSQIPKLTPAGRGFLHQVDAALNRFDALASEVTQPVNSLLATVTFAQNIPGRILGTIDRCVERTARLYDGLRNFPARFAAGINFGLAKIEADMDRFLPADRYGAKTAVMKHLRIASARRLALETAYLYADDADQRRSGERGMNVVELEQTLADARTRLADETIEARRMLTLKEMAVALEQSVTAVKSGAERVVAIVVDPATPLHLICLRQGLTYADAERIMSLNPGLRNPTFAAGEVQVYG